MLGYGLMAHAGDTAENEDISQAVGHAEDDLFDQHGFNLSGRLDPGLGALVDVIQFRAARGLSVVAKKEIPGDAKQEGAGVADFYRLGLPQDAQIGFLQEVLGDVRAVSLAQRTQQPVAVRDKQGLGIIPVRKNGRWPGDTVPCQKSCLQ